MLMMLIRFCSTKIFSLLYQYIIAQFLTKPNENVNHSLKLIALRFSMLISVLLFAIRDIL